MRRAVDLGPTHLACYGLTYEPQTALTARRDRGHVIPCDEALEAEMFEATIEWLADEGFEHYELSNYARPGQRCEHNLCYWRNEPYLGVGPSAASYIDGRRWRNLPNLDRYVQVIETGESAEIECETLDPLAALRETAMLGLRLRDGIDAGAVSRRFGVDPIALFAPLMGPHVEAGLLELDAGRITLTRRGLLFANDVMGDFLVGPVDATCLPLAASNTTVHPAA
jgi:oxygen-independent coproporphyrinogen-3 oxidase